jgi:hypothetical protein
MSLEPILPIEGKLTRREVLAGSTLGAIAWSDLSASENPAEPFWVTPYVQLGNAPRASATESLAVMWHCRPDVFQWSVQFRQAESAEWQPAVRHSKSSLSASNIPAHDVWEFVMFPLMPGTPVDYRVLLNEQQVFSATATVRPAAGKGFRCVIMGDCGTNSAPQKQIAHQVHRAKPEFVVIPGDFVYNNGRISEYRSSFFPIYSQPRPAADRGAPLLSSVCLLGGRGQHDTEGAFRDLPDAHAFFEYWSFPLNGPVVQLNNRHVYPLQGTAEQEGAFLASAGAKFPRMTSFSFDWGNSHWMVLDTWNPHADWTDPALRQWVQEDWASAKQARWKFVSSYMPPFSSSTAYPQGQKMRVLADLWEAAGVDLVFSGYAHSYQRTKPLRFKPEAPQGPISNPAHKVPGTFAFDDAYDGEKRTRPNGIIYVVTGCGGNPGLHSPEQTDNPQTWQPYTVRYNASVHQFTQLDVEDRQLTVRQIDLNGNEVDRFVVAKS